MIMNMVLMIILQEPKNTNVQAEYARISDIMRQHDAFSAKRLEALASWQVESLVKAQTITEFDEFGRTFAQRAIAAGFDLNKHRLDEFYFKTPGPLDDAYIWDIYCAVKFDGFSHYGFAIRERDGFFYYVFTLIDLRTFI
jgi:hypothetical protein